MPYWFFSGVQVGLILCLLTGPIFFALLQTGIEQGFRAGAMVGLGIWISDLLFILAVYFGLAYVKAITNWDGFELTIGVIGGIILIAFGLGTYFTKAPQLSEELEEASQYMRTSSWISLWTKGFLINTVNPFTLFFWLGLMTGVLANNDLSGGQASAYFFGILLVIVVTDSLKVGLAKLIRKRLKQTHLNWVRKISGLALVIFGIVLLVRVIY